MSKAPVAGGTRARNRDDFSMPVKRGLAERAAYFCSNPQCLRLTAGPRSGTERGLRTGHAAHIRGASPEGPRYDPAQTAEERKAAANGIWLCRECGVMVDEDHDGFTVDELERWKRNHEAMIAEVRQKGWAESLNLLTASRDHPAVARRVLALFEDRRAFWVAFDAEFPDRVRLSLDGLRHDLANCRQSVMTGSPLDTMIVALSQTIRHFFDAVEDLDLVTLRCDSYDPDWRRFQDALGSLRKSIGFQAKALAEAYDLPLQGEFGEAFARAD